ncbi:hypothetical protein TrispH2_000087 [Trichoplax sp. H2]|uniref:Expressed protein n=1 Tax=Trichoplax adhaerens TaxID=10228 RepID=B3RID2_TRIAD|nr:expressed protein [Trichoplax adhaerens]EDV29732.1 expressed protein [Trichoplax adhaerens]RDD47266.1 hypothetical protein TrispH2_000087 [Trichoplax sp. H2]|eukprot:XP_002108934.1 expressed protein [Trichoplax adhaerens]
MPRPHLSSGKKDLSTGTESNKRQLEITSNPFLEDIGNKNNQLFLLRLPAKLEVKNLLNHKMSINECCTLKVKMQKETVKFHLQIRPYSAANINRISILLPSRTSTRLRKAVAFTGTVNVARSLKIPSCRVALTQKIGNEYKSSNYN